jgi:hypothetical protein
MQIFLPVATTVLRKAVVVVGLTVEDVPVNACWHAAAIAALGFGDGVGVGAGLAVGDAVGVAVAVALGRGVGVGVVPLGDGVGVAPPTPTPTPGAVGVVLPPPPPPLHAASTTHGMTSNMSRRIGESIGRTVFYREGQCTKRARPR